MQVKDAWMAQIDPNQRPHDRPPRAWPIWSMAVQWTPLALRQFDLETGQMVLGHRQAVVTQIYAERDEEVGITVRKGRLNCLTNACFCGISN